MRPHQFKWLREFLASSLHALHRKLEEAAENQEKAASKAAQSTEEEHGTIPGVISRIAVAIESANADVETYEKPQRDKEYRLQRRSLLPTWITAVATTGAFVGALIYACIANRQLVSMNQTYSQIENQTTLMRQQMEATNAGVVRSPEIDFSLPNREIRVTLVNIGHSPVNALYVDSTVSYIALPSGATIGNGQTRKIGPLRIVAPPQNTPQTLVQGDPNKFDWMRPLTLGSIDTLVEQGRAAIKDDISFSYFNGFETISDTNCMIFMYWKGEKVGSAQPEAQTIVRCEDLRDGISAQNEKIEKQKEGAKRLSGLP